MSFSQERKRVVEWRVAGGWGVGERRMAGGEWGVENVLALGPNTLVLGLSDPASGTLRSVRKNSALALNHPMDCEQLMVPG